MKYHHLLGLVVFLALVHDHYVCYEDGRAIVPADMVKALLVQDDQGAWPKATFVLTSLCSRECLLDDQMTLIQDETNRLMVDNYVIKLKKTNCFLIVQTYEASCSCPPTIQCSKLCPCEKENAALGSLLFHSLMPSL